MRKEYEVAGHRFAVVMPDNEVAWNSMRSYKPFEVDGTGECIFTAELIEAMPDITEKKRITVSCSGSDMARIELYEYNNEWLMELAPTMNAPVRAYLITDKAFKHARFRMLGSIWFSLNTVMMMMFAFATARRNT